MWVIGCIRGRLDLLQPLVGASITDRPRERRGRKVVVFLGDYVDRAPNSRSVIRHSRRPAG